MPHITIRKNGGSVVTGAVTCDHEDEIRLRVSDPASIGRSVRFELYGYPAGWAAPTGWTEDTASRVIYATVAEPDDFTLPTLASGLWGKWLTRLLIDGVQVDDASALEILSELGLHALPAGEGGQFGGTAQAWGKHLEENLRILNTAVAAAGTGSDELWGVSVDGARTESGGGAAAALAQPRFYSGLTLSSATTLSMAGYRLHVDGTLTVGESCALHNDGATSTGQAGGAGAPVGELASATVGGVTGAGINSAGSGAAGNASSPAVGGAGGPGGASNVPHAGGAAPTVTLTVTSHGLPWSRLALEMMVCLFAGTTFNKFRGGAGGASGGGSLSGVGGGGGGSGGLGWIRARHVVNNGRISCRGGAGGPAGTDGGGGGGGGGGLLVIWCESWTGSPPDCDGGAGGAGNGGGVSGSTGSEGKCLVFVKGVLKFRSGFGANAPDIDELAA